MRVIAWKMLRIFSDRHPQARVALRAWYTLTQHAVWKTPADVRKTFNTADFVGTHVVFDIGGNRYRIVAAVDYRRSLVFTLWVGTHAAYDKINVRTVKYEPPRQR
jgi:mRNA interferase HigB